MINLIISHMCAWFSRLINVATNAYVCVCGIGRIDSYSDHFISIDVIDVDWCPLLCSIELEVTVIYQAIKLASLSFQSPLEAVSKPVPARDITSICLNSILVKHFIFSLHNKAIVSQRKIEFRSKNCLIEKSHSNRKSYCCNGKYIEILGDLAWTLLKEYNAFVNSNMPGYLLNRWHQF